VSQLAQAPTLGIVQLENVRFHAHQVNSTILQPILAFRNAPLVSLVTQSPEIACNNVLVHIREIQSQDFANRFVKQVNISNSLPILV